MSMFNTIPYQVTWLVCHARFMPSIHYSHVLRAYPFTTPLLEVSLEVEFEIWGVF